MGIIIHCHHGEEEPSETTSTKLKGVGNSSQKRRSQMRSFCQLERKKTTTNGEKQQQKDDTVKRTAYAPEISTMGKTWKEVGKEHPSWAAEQSQ